VIPAASYGWIQIKGPATVNQAVPGTDGGALAAGTVDGALIASTAYIDHVAAIAIDASAKIVLLDCPF